MGEMKSDFKPLNEESIVEFFFISFQGPYFIDEPMMEEDHTVLKTPSVDQAIEKRLILPPTSSPSRYDVEQEF